MSISPLRYISCFSYFCWPMIVPQTTISPVIALFLGHASICWGPISYKVTTATPQHLRLSVPLGAEPMTLRYDRSSAGSVGLFHPDDAQIPCSAGQRDGTLDSSQAHFYPCIAQRFTGARNTQILECFHLPVNLSPVTSSVILSSLLLIVVLDDTFACIANIAKP